MALPIFKRMSEEDVFRTPAELQCPISHNLFHDPVITAAGNVYEREAILRHFASSSSDPLTGLPLASRQLTPVFLLKSRALEYAENAIHLCLEATTAPGCVEPARWLRRAVDLCEESGVRPIMLSESCVKFTLQHRSSQHDGSVLFCFAQGLIAIGETQLALALYSNMLQLEQDRRAHAAIIKRCLPCWQVLIPGESEGELRADAVAAFIRGQQVLDACTALDILQSLQVPSRVVLKVCRLLLLTETASSQAPLPRKGSFGALPREASTRPSTDRSSSGLLAKFVELSEAETARCVKQVNVQAQHLQAQVQGLQDRLEAANARRGAQRRAKLRHVAIAVSLLSPLVPGWPGRVFSSVPVVALWLQR